MEHVRSTLAASAIAVFGLAVAAHSLYSSSYGLQAAPARPVAATPLAVTNVAATPVAWTDPPARAANPETTGTIRPDAGAAALPPALPTPQRAAVMPPGASPALPLPSEMATNRVDPIRKAVAARRPHASERAAHRSARLRNAGLARTATVDPAALAPAASPPAQAASRIDPIGDILRGLGFGRDS